MMRIATSLLALGAVGAICAPAAMSADNALVLYASLAPAQAIVDGGRDLPPVAASWRQGPVYRDEARWPASREMAKIKAEVIEPLSEDGMYALLRQQLDAVGPSGRVGIDEITRTKWTPAAAQALGGALARLGSDAERVVVYVGPSLTERVGRYDPQLPLRADLQVILDAIARAGAVYIELYNGDTTPVPQMDFARYPTRWLERWPAERRSSLRLMFGPPGEGVSAPMQWQWARASAAGRELLGHGVAVWGLREAHEGSAWLAGYRSYLADPTAVPAGGDYAIPAPGSVRIRVASTVRPSAPVRVSLGRRGWASVVLVRGSTRRTLSIIRNPRGPMTRTVRLPADLLPGRYRVRVTHKGDEITDRVIRTVTVR